MRGERWQVLTVGTVLSYQICGRNWEFPVHSTIEKKNLSSSTQSGLVAMMVLISSLSTLFLFLGKQLSFLLVEEFLVFKKGTFPRGGLRGYQSVNHNRYISIITKRHDANKLM